MQMFLKLEYKRLQENRFDTIYTDHVDCNSLTISLLNTRSLKKACCRYQQSQTTYRKRYRMLDRESYYK